MDEIIGNAAAVTITVGMPDPGAPTARAERLIRRAALTSDDAELALTYIVADRSGLEPGERLFRREAPAELPDAAWLRLTGETPEASTDCRRFTVRFSGREVENGAVFPGIFAALGKLPVQWLTVDGGELAVPVTVEELKLVRPAGFGCVFACGRRAATFDAELDVRIRTAPLR